jgi:Cd2+/Zn2+-exporting ATPase
VISTPVSLISAISNAARNGVIIKGGKYLEILSQVKAFAFDKTGTLTWGKPAVVAIQSTGCTNPQTNFTSTGQLSGLHDADVMLFCDSCNDVLALANAVEQHSEHPLAQAVVDESSRRGLQDRYPAAEQVKAMLGEGVTGVVTDRRVMLGSHRYFDTHIPHQEEHCTQANVFAEQGYTPILMGLDGEYVGTITVADTLRENSQEAISMLTREGIRSCILLTGDNDSTARLVGEQVGMTEVHSGLLPQDKLAAVAELQSRFGKVAMVGDGINDAPALAAADIGIAMGAAANGTTQAMETADITLMSEDLRALPFTYKLSKKAMRIIFANIALSLGIKLAFMLLVLFGFGTLWMAVLADVGTTLLVTLNSMRLLRMHLG